MAAEEHASVATPVAPEKYSWHDSPWGALTRDLSRLPHALLLYGQSGLGKRMLALRLAQLLLCQAPTADKQACGACQGCRLFRAGTHPDLLRIEPLEDSNNILVDQVRGVVEFLAYKPHTAAHKVVIIAPAEAMNVNAANSLLKILEEPPAGSVLILIATHLARVSVTIRSRCRRMPLGVPAEADALAWLQSRKLALTQAQELLSLAGGAPLGALRLSRDGHAEGRREVTSDLTALAQRKGDPVACAERWKGTGTNVCLERLHRFLLDIIRTQAGTSMHGTTVVATQDRKSFSLSIIDLFGFIDRVSIARQQLGTGIDETLMLEELLIRWCEITGTQPP